MKESGECQQCKELARRLKLESKSGDLHFDNANVLLEGVIALQTELEKVRKENADLERRLVNYTG